MGAMQKIAWRLLPSAFATNERTHHSGPTGKEMVHITITQIFLCHCEFTTCFEILKAPQKYVITKCKM